MTTETHRQHFIRVGDRAWRITRHAIQKACDTERGGCETVEEALNLITSILEFPSAEYRSKRHPHQHKVHDRDGRLVLAIDKNDFTVVTVFVSGHRKINRKEVK